MIILSSAQGNNRRVTACAMWRLLLAILVVLVSSHLSGCTSTGHYSVDSEPNRYQKSSARFHKVKPGDTLYAVSFKAGVDFKKLAAWNGLRKPYIISAGQILRLVPPQSAKKPVRKYKPPPRKKQVAKSVYRKKYVPAPPVSANAKNLNWKWPTRGKVASYFSSADSSRDGIKISGRKNQKILAAERGKIVYVGSGLVGYGRLIIIKHNNKYLSAYGLNSKLLVKEGDTVRKGQHIANMGLANSGTPMLHFEIRRSGKPVNPLSYLPK